MGEREEQAAGASPVTMVERVARAIEQEFGPIYGHLCRHEDAVSCARAAIAAMREPTEAMMDLGATVRGNHQPFGSPHDWNNDTNCAGIWRAMIDGALKP